MIKITLEKYAEATKGGKHQGASHEADPQKEKSGSDEGIVGKDTHV